MSTSHDQYFYNYLSGYLHSTLTKLESLDHKWKMDSFFLQMEKELTFYHLKTKCITTSTVLCKWIFYIYISSGCATENMVNGLQLQLFSNQIFIMKRPCFYRMADGVYWSERSASAALTLNGVFLSLWALCSFSHKGLS